MLKLVIPTVITIHDKLMSEDIELGYSSHLVFWVFYSLVSVPRFLSPILLTLVYRDDVGGLT